MNTLFQKAIELLEAKTPFALAVITSQDGSTPRGAGTKMLVLPDAIVGTVGGGGMEGHVIKIARESVLVDKKPVLRHYNMHADEAAVGSFICGGDCETLTAYIDPEDENSLEVFRAALEAERTGARAWFIYVVNTNDNAQSPFTLCLNVGGEKLIGAAEGSENVVRDMIKSPVRLAIHGDATDGVYYFVDPVHSGGLIYLFGGGHVSLEVARLAAHLEFRVVVFDDREEFANPERFPECETVVLDSFDNIPDYKVDKDSYILVITRGHAHDKTALEWALKYDVKYIGMIGSKTKRDAIYSALEKQGVPRERLEWVCSPVGLPIGAQTPAEIAVSIMAEIIERKNKGEGAK